MARSGIERRIGSLESRIRALAGLRRLVGLPPRHDLTSRQWRVLEGQLQTASSGLEERLRVAARALLASGDGQSLRKLNRLLGKLELDLARNYNFFDTYMDVLTQRLTPELGVQLAGCDVLAWDAQHRDHPTLRRLEAPLVFCDRGFGASIIREGVRLPRLPANPLPLIQIPYSKLQEKQNLTSVVHEVGHQAITQLNLVRPMRDMIRRGVAAQGTEMAGYFALWSFEIGPDFWGFGLTGPAQASSLRDILALPGEQVFRITTHDPHPPPYLRVLLGFECCRQVWGRGRWDAWERDWLRLYPLEDAPPDAAKLLERGARALPAVARFLLEARIPPLRRPIPDLLDLSAIDARRLEERAAAARSGRLNLTGMRPCAQLAVFRAVYDMDCLDEQRFDAAMNRWLASLASRRSAERTSELQLT